MGTSYGTIEFLIEQLEGIGDITSKKMFGEYIIYLNAKPVFLICDDTLFVKILPETADLLKENNPIGSPYNGAKPHYIIDNTDDREYLQKLAIILEQVIPFPKKKET